MKEENNKECIEMEILACFFNGDALCGRHLGRINMNGCLSVLVLIFFTLASSKI